jgi:imidazolonepropionase-like amidohydrolase
VVPGREDLDRISASPSAWTAGAAEPSGTAVVDFCMKTGRIVALAGALALLAGRHVAAQPALVIEELTIVDPAAVVPLSVGTLVVRDGRIAAIGSAAVRPPEARVVNGRGRYAVAGLWDMHAHLAALTPIGRAPERYVGHGVLHVRDMGGFLDQLLPLREDIRAGRRVGPNLVIAGPTLNSAQHADFHRSVTTDAEARVAVRDLKARGVDFLKVHRATNRAAFAAIADEARTSVSPWLDTCRSSCPGPTRRALV